MNFGMLPPVFVYLSFQCLTVLVLVLHFVDLSDQCFQSYRYRSKALAVVRANLVGAVCPIWAAPVPEA